MNKRSGVLPSAMNPHARPVAPPRLLVELDPAHRVFLRNLGDLLSFRRPPRVPVTSRPAPFWPDVFVPSRSLWWPFLESVLWHLLAGAAIWAFGQGVALQTQALPRTVFNPSDVIYYTPSEYLPPLDTGSFPARVPQTGKPELARQPIISVPPEADNRTQTVVTPPKVNLTHEIPLPNIVAWHSASPAVPLSATNRSQLVSPTLATPVVAPPPDVNQIRAYRTHTDLPESAIAPPPDMAAATSRKSIAPLAAVIEPPPAVQGTIRRVRDMNIGRSEVVAPAPELPMDTQRALSTLEQTLTQAALGSAAQVVPPPPSVEGTQGGGLRATNSLTTATAQVVPPPPSIPGAAGTSGAGRLIALGIHPIAGPPPVPVVGNRRGAFSATPEGKRGAPGTPDISADAHGLGHSGGHGNENGGAGSATNSSLPPGIVVGPGPRNRPASTVAGDPRGSSNGGAGDGSASASAPNTLMADALPVRVTPRRMLSTTSLPTELERQVFGARKFYSMILNMPNLNSGGGSWIIRFAELRGDDREGDLTAPEATHKVDPGYPLELMRQNVHGTVTLYAVIRSDGTVGGVRVLNSPDERLDSYARTALTGWRFRPATKNGSPVDLEAVVIIPFRATRNF
ncbi:MAG TPA: TonB family protein [Terriglobales bacterium]|nr:TonB family protein [Terriglobales bacterium]